MDTTTNAAPPAAPEIDEEMAALEAGSAGAQGATREDATKVQQAVNALVAKLTGQRSGKGVPTQGPGPKQRSGVGRMTRRAMERGEPGYRPDPRKSPHARLGRAKPVKSAWQIQMEMQSQARAALCRIKVANIVQHCPDLKYVVGVPGLKNVWQLSQAPTEFILAIPGFGPKRREAVAKYLREHNVPIKWDPKAKLVGSARKAA